MPTYEYACTSCGQHIEVVQSMSDQALRTCGACGGQLRKVFSPIGIVFKGSGFYRTDSRSAGNGKPGTSGKPAAASGDTSSSSEKAGDKSGEKSTTKASDSSEKSA